MPETDSLQAYLQDVAFDARLTVPVEDLERALDAVEGLSEAEGWGVTFPSTQGILGALESVSGGPV